MPNLRLQNSLLFERIPLTAEVTVCVRGGSAPTTVRTRQLFLQCAPQLTVEFRKEGARR
jgi:hypothetical protein